MNLSDITKEKVKSFLQGYSRYYYDNIFSLQEYIKEQVYHRLSVCKDSCLITGKCEKCECPTIQKSYADKSCNSEKFPDLMSKQEWEVYKRENNIPDYSSMKNEIDSLISKLK